MRIILTISLCLALLTSFGQHVYDVHRSDMGSISPSTSLSMQMHRQLKLKPNEELRLISQETSPFAQHYTFQHYVEGKEVLFSLLKLHIRKDGSMTTQNFLAKNVVASFDDDMPYLVRKNDGLVSASKLPNGDENHADVYVSANQEVVLEVPLHKYYRDTTVKVHVFGVNPINTANTTYGGVYVDNGDASNPSLDSQRMWMDVYARFSNDTFYLNSDYLYINDYQFYNISDTMDYQVMNDSFSFTRNEQMFELVNVYYHVQTMGEYVSSLGYDSITTKLAVDPHGTGQDNSWFTPSDFSLTFGDGGVDDGEDGEVVIHEYVHSLSERASFGTTIGNERESMEEGSCDYMAKAYSRTFNDNSSNRIFSWDGHNQFWNGFNINTNRTYPTDLVGSKDGDRDMWSSALMCGHDLIGRATMDSLVLAHFYYQGPNTTMTQMADVILDIDSADFNGRNYFELKGCFVEAGFLKYGVSVDESELAPAYRVLNTYNFSKGSGSAQFRFDEDVILTVYSDLGQVLFSLQGQSFDLAPEDYPKGLYIVKIKAKQGETSYKLLR